MLSKIALDRYRRMTPKERFAEMRDLMDLAARALAVLPPAERARRLAAETRIRRESIEAFLRGLSALDGGSRSRHGG